MVDPVTLRSNIAHLAGRQWGHVTREQLIGAGMASSTVSAWLREGKLVQAHAGVYAVGYRRLEPRALACAAVLACGADAVLSHDSALALWGLRRWPRVPEVIAPGRVRRPGIRTHRSTTLHSRDITTEFGIRVTRPARALHDMRGRLTARQRTRLTNAARLARVITADDAERLLGHRNNPTRSELEDDFQRWIDAHDLPQPIVNARVAGHEVDAYFPDHGVIVEIDEYATHSDPVTFASDRERDAAHLALGLDTVRILRERFTRAEADRLRAILARRAGPPPC